MPHLLRVTDLSTAEIERIFAITADLKSKFAQGIRESLLPGRVIGMLFEKPSLRTRGQLRSRHDAAWRRQFVSGQRRRLRLARKCARFCPRAQPICRWHRDSRQSASNRRRSSGPQHVSRDQRPDRLLPILARRWPILYTLREIVGPLKGLTLAYVGDANNVARSLVEGCGRLGMRIVLATPKAYQFSAAEIARHHNVKFRSSISP